MSNGQMRPQCVFFIRPLAGSLLGYAAGTEMGPVIQVIMTLFADTVALDSHLTKATTKFGNQHNARACY